LRALTIMNTHSYELNLLLAWFWIAMGILSGMLLGIGFHREQWLGGYGSFRRRLYRLGHISFFGLALLNLGFFFTVRAVGIEAGLGAVGSWGFVLGALTMPFCCLVMAHRPSCYPLFAIPVLSLATAASATLWGLAGSCL
jgi:hypothetical protein